MIPGVWLELEVMGINCHMAQEVPDDWFFMRHGNVYMIEVDISLTTEIQKFVPMQIV